MARIRTIKPEFWTSEQIVECSTNARLLFVGMWNFADDAGRLTNHPKTLKMKIYPGDNLCTDDVAKMIQELERQKLIFIYRIEDEEYIQITGWHHQKIDRPQPSKIPPPFDDHSTNVRRTIVDGREGNGRDSKGKEVSSSGLTPDLLIKTDTSVERDGQNGKMVLPEMDKPSKPVLTRRCSDKNVDVNGSRRKKIRDDWPLDYREQFWKTYPHKIGKKVAIHKLDRVFIEGEVTFETLMAGLTGYIRTKPVDRPWCNPLTWLNQGRWDDQPAPVVHVVRPQDEQYQKTQQVMHALREKIRRHKLEERERDASDGGSDENHRLLCEDDGERSGDIHREPDCNVENLFALGSRACRQIG